MSILVLSVLSTQALHVHAELKQFNVSLANIGHNEDSSSLTDELRFHLKRHLAIAEKIRTISGIFEVYEFAMFATNIPLVIFTLFTLIVRMHVALIDAILTLPEVVLGFMKVIFLLHIPSKIQAEAMNTSTVLCSNKKVWLTKDRRVYELANILITHASQEDLSLAIWCMTAISKPFILTGSSVVITSLMFLVQYHFHCNPSNSNDMMPGSFNFTGIE
jgi:hypothetical protein